MPRKGKARNAGTMTLHATTRDVNTATPHTGKRVRMATPVTGAHVPSSAVFPAMHVRPVEGQSSRGQWLFRRAMDESVSTSKETAADRAKRARDVRLVGLTDKDMRSALRRAERDLAEIERLLAEGRAADFLYIVEEWREIKAAFVATGDYEAAYFGYQRLRPRRITSDDWAAELRDRWERGRLSADTVRSMLEARKARAAEIKRRNDVRNGRKAPTTADFRLWDTKGVTPKPRGARKVTLAPVFSEDDAMRATLALTTASHGPDKYNTRGTD